MDRKPQSSQNCLHLVDKKHIACCVFSHAFGRLQNCIHSYSFSCSWSIECLAIATVIHFHMTHYTQIIDLNESFWMICVLATHHLSEIFQLDLKDLWIFLVPAFFYCASDSWKSSVASSHLISQGWKKKANICVCCGCFISGRSSTTH